MKKLLSLLLAFMLILGAAASLAEERNTNINFDPFSETGKFLANVFLYKGKLVGSDSENIYELNIDTKEVKLIAKRDITKDVYLGNLFAYKDELYSFDQGELVLTKIDISGENPVKGDDVHDFEPNVSDIDWDAADCAFVYGDSFYVNVKDASQMTSDQLLCSFNFETGEEKYSQIKNISYAAPYKDGKLLVALSPEGFEPYGEATDFALAVYDPSSDSIVGTIAVLKGIESHLFPHIFYYANRDSVYVIKGAEIFKLNSDGSLEITAYLPCSLYGLQGFLEMPDGRLVFSIYMDSCTIAVRDLDPAKKPERALKLVNIDEYYMLKALKNMADVPVVMLEDYSDSAQDMAAKIISASDSFDMTLVNPDYIDTDTLIKKGYVAEIKNEKLIAFANSLAEPLKSMIFKDGKLYALPQVLDLKSYVYDIEGFKNANMPVPTSYLGLLKSYYDFSTGDSELKEKYNFSNYDWGFKELANAVSYYAESKVLNGEDVVFNTPEFKELIAQVKKNADEIKEVEINWSDDDETREYYEKINLVQDIMSGSPASFSPSSYMSELERSMAILKLPVFDGGEPFAQASTSLFMINSKSKNIDLAERLLENFVDSLDPAYAAMLRMKLDGAIENPNFEQNKANLDEQVKQIKAAAEKLSGAEKENFLERFNYTLNNYDQIIGRMRYIVKPDAVDVFNDLASQKLYIKTYIGSLYSSDKILTDDLEERYMNGTINEDMLASELDNKAKLVRLEQQ